LYHSSASKSFSQELIEDASDHHVAGDGNIEWRHVPAEKLQLDL
jgi:hypothetical protein